MHLASLATVRMQQTSTSAAAIITIWILDAPERMLTQPAGRTMHSCLPFMRIWVVPTRCVSACVTDHNVHCSVKLQLEQQFPFAQCEWTSLDYVTGYRVNSDRTTQLCSALIWLGIVQCIMIASVVTATHRSNSANYSATISGHVFEVDLGCPNCIHLDQHHCIISHNKLQPNGCW